MEERMFFTQGNVSVSNARFIVSGQTYAMNGVTSVKQSVTKPSRTGPVILFIIGLLPLFSGTGGGVVITVALIIGAVLWWRNQQPLYTVVLSSSSGEAQALSSQDSKYIASVIDALNHSIVHR